ncbi:hypothetical protein QW180_23180 [Vibrio sinaloensis]|nr:hypothetical protein [Vibrio sinaloensis]
MVHTSRDKQFDVEGYELQALRDHALTNLKKLMLTAALMSF